MKKRKKFGRERDPLALRPEAFGFLFAMPAIEEDATVIDGIAVLSIDGPLEHKASWCWDSYEAIGARFARALFNPDVRSILLKIDSPGGDVAGLIETVRDLQALKAEAGKPVFAYVDEGAYSAGYALACIADEIYMPETGGVGSIGVITALCDVTKMNADRGLRVEVISSGDKKTDGDPDVPISNEAIARTKARVDQLAEIFFAEVATSRGIDVDAIRNMQAGCFFGAGAVAAGLADGVMGLSAMLEAIESSFDSAGSVAVNQETNATQSARVGDDMLRLLAAQKALNAARAQLAKAKTETDRSKAARAITKAEADVKAADPKAGKVTEKTTTKTENDDGSSTTEKETHTTETVSTPATQEAEEPSEAAKDPDEDEEDDEEKDDDKAIAAVARSLTGKASRAEVIGAMHSMADHAEDGRAAVAELRTVKNGPSVEAMVSDAIKAGRLDPAKKDKATKLGREQGKAALKAYLDDREPMVATVDIGGYREPKPRGTAPGSGPELTEAERSVAAKLKTNVENLAAHKAKRAV